MPDSPFVLKPSGLDWAGPSGKKVTIGVRPTDPSIQLMSVFYPAGKAGTSIPVANNQAVITTLAGGPTTLSATIKTVLPPLDWQLVEVGTDGTTQVLETSYADDDVPYYISIGITGS